MSISIWWILVGLILVEVIFNQPDDSDKSFFSRSGMSIYTDYKTGLQYMKGGIFGGLTPRMDENGKQMRVK